MFIEKKLTLDFFVYRSEKLCVCACNFRRQFFVGMFRKIAKNSQTSSADCCFIYLRYVTNNYCLVYNVSNSFAYIIYTCMDSTYDRFIDFLKYVIEKKILYSFIFVQKSMLRYFVCLDVYEKVKRMIICEYVFVAVR
jgi:hypothetical protein